MRKSMRTIIAMTLTCLLLLLLPGVSLAALKPVTGIKTSVTSSTVKVSWKAFSGAAEYKVFTAKSSKGEYTYAGSSQTAAFTLEGLAAKQTIYIKVAAHDAEENAISASSAAKKATTNISGKNSRTGVQEPLEVLKKEYQKIVDEGKIRTADFSAYLAQLNAERAKVGAKALVISPELMMLAAVKAADMYNNNYINSDHRSPTYGSVIQFTEHFTGHRANENFMDATGEWRADHSSTIALGNSIFMNSKSHRDCRLNPKSNTVGFCIYDGGDRIVIVEHFYL